MYEILSGECPCNNCEDCFKEYGQCPEELPTHILWLSRHEMTPEQKDGLAKSYGSVWVCRISKTFSNVEEILGAVNEHRPDVLAVVLPDMLIAELLTKVDMPIIRSVSGRIPTGKKEINPANGQEEEVFAFSHIRWEQVISLDIATEDLETGDRYGNQYVLIVWKHVKPLLLNPWYGSRTPWQEGAIPDNDCILHGLKMAFNRYEYWNGKGSKYRPMEIVSLK